MSDPGPELGDIVREKRYAQPLEVTHVSVPTREAETVPLGSPPDTPGKWHKFEELQPYKKE